MELHDELVNLNGYFTTLNKIIETASILLQYSNKKTLSAISIQNAIRIHFSDLKRRKAIVNGTKNVTKYIASDYTNKPINFDIILNIIKELCKEYNINKVDNNAVIYISSIYKDIEKYSLKELINNNISENINENINITKFIDICDIIKECNQNMVLSIKHFNVAKQIISPNKELNLNWDIEKNNNAIEDYINENYDIKKINKNFLELLQKY